MKKIFLGVITFFVITLTYAQNEKTELLYSNKFTLGSDLFQPILLGGFNINATYTTNRWIFDYSHGMGLEIRDNLQTTEQKDLNSKIELPWTTGPGFGYRFTSNFDARLDFKVHSVEVDLLSGQQTLDYLEYTIGPGIFYRFYFGENSGFGLETSARYWFDFGNNLNNLVNDKFNFVDNDGNTRTFDPSVSSGVGFNIALIYTFNKNN